MERQGKQHGAGKWRWILPAAVLLLSVTWILTFRRIRYQTERMQRLAENVIRPLHRALTEATARVPFSVAELLIGLAAAALLLYLGWNLIRLIRKPDRLRRLGRMLLTLAAAGCAVYAGFCLLWGVYYYGTDFSAESGLRNEPVSVEQLTEVTEYFAGIANSYAGQVERGEGGVYAGDRDAILERADQVFLALEKKIPCLQGPAVRAKGIRFSRIMSYLDFTGFFFPFTAEANVNMDFPAAELAATVAHELSHQRGVAKEQEANFTAILACMEYGDPDYVYSAALMATNYLTYALSSADPEACTQIIDSLDKRVLRDYESSNEYWEQLATPVKKVSNAVYEDFLYGYDQTMGLRSYGACVDLLVQYYAG